MNAHAIERDVIALAFLNSAVSRLDINEALNFSSVRGAKTVAAEIAELSFAIADAMLAERAKGESA